MNNIKNNEFKTSYNFGKYTDDVNNYLNILLYNHTSKYPRDNKKIYIGLNCINNYLNSFYKKDESEDKKEFRLIFQKLFRNLYSLTFLPENERGIFGRYDSDNKAIYFNSNLDDESINDVIGQELIYLQNNNYNTEYNFGDYTNDVNDYLSILLRRHINSCQKDRKKFDKALKYFDYYLHYYYENDKSEDKNEFKSIFRNLIRNLSSFTFLPENKRGIFGRYYKNAVYFNPDLDDKRMGLYIFHELGHVQNSKWRQSAEQILSKTNLSDDAWMKKMREILGKGNAYDATLNFLRQLIIDSSDDNIELMRAGFILLDEATTQDRAEDILCRCMNKIRKPMEEHDNHSRLFNGEKIMTNFDYYGEFQVPTIMFARTLKDIGMNLDVGSTMIKFDKKSLSESFADDIFKEYIVDYNQVKKLLEMLKNLGIIKAAKYSTFIKEQNKKSQPNYLSLSNNALEEYVAIVGDVLGIRSSRGMSK